MDSETIDRDLEAIDLDSEASDQDPEASEHDPEASDASYLQPRPARQYNDGGKAALSTVVVDVNLFTIVVVVAETVQNGLRHDPRGGRITIRICRHRHPRLAADYAAR